MYVTRFSVGTDRCMPRSGTTNVSLKLHRVEWRQMTLSAVNTNGRWCDGLMMKMMMVMMLNFVHWSGIADGVLNEL